MTDCDVLICGLGPVGQVLALLLGDLGVRTIAVEEGCEPHPLPRAAVTDDEVLRILQAVGLDGPVLADAQVQETVTYLTRRGRPIDVLRLGGAASGAFGHPPLVSINQALMERTLVAALEARGAVELLWGQRVETIDRASTHVTAWVRPLAGGRARPLRARYLVGCDGARSTVRSRLQIPFGGSTFAQRWLVVDARVDRPLARVPHPHFAVPGDAWLAAHGADWALLRPDRFVFACGGPAEISPARHALAALVGAGVRSESPQVRVAVAA